LIYSLKLKLLLFNTRSVNDLEAVLPPSTYHYFKRTTLHFLTTNKL